MNITSGKVAKAQRCVIYGPEGIGKSSFAAQFPDPIFIDTEGSTSNMNVKRLDNPSSYEFMKQQINFIKQNKPCKTLIIDTIDWGERLIIEYLCSNENKKSIEDFGYGAGFIKLEEELGRFLNLLQEVVDAGIHMVLTAHAQIKKFEQPDEMGAYDRYELKLGKKTTAKTSALVKEWADMVLFMNYKTFSVATDDKGKKHKGQGGVRTIYATHHPAWDAKNRHDLPDEFPMDYGQIAHIFDQGQPMQTQTAQNEPPVQTEQQTTPATVPDQTQESQSSDQSSNTSNSILPELDPNIPQSLRDLMQQHEVTEKEIQEVVSSKGYYPIDTPIVNYDASFIDGVLVGAWQQVFEMIKKSREEKIPFN